MYSIFKKSEQETNIIKFKELLHVFNFVKFIIYNKTLFFIKNFKTLITLLFIIKEFINL